MALDYAFYLSTRSKPDDVVRLLEAGMGVELRRWPAERPGLVVAKDAATDLSVRAYRTDDRHGAPEAQLGFEASVLVVFRLDKFADRQAQIIALLKGTMSVLENDPGDAALLFDVLVWFVRKDGLLILNSGAEVWRPEYLGVVTEDYELRDVPVLT